MAVFPPGTVLPIFPLPQVVLLPAELLPLHVFEARYRELLKDCLAGHRMMGICTLKHGHGWDERGRPPVFEHMGVGRVVRHQALPDGRANIIVEHVATGLVEEELDLGRPYRSVRWSPVPAIPPESYPDLRSTKMLAIQVVSRVGPSVDTSAWMGMPGEAWLHMAARIFLNDVGRRLIYLRARGGRERQAVVSDAIAEVMAFAEPTQEA